MSVPQSLYWRQPTLSILDQSVLPHRRVYLNLDDKKQVFEAIKMLRVRGAPAIGICAAYGLCVAAQEYLQTSCAGEFRQQVRADAEYLASCRPTAVNLAWALSQVINSFDATLDVQQQYNAMVLCAEDLHRADQAACNNIAQIGLPLIADGMAILTHCNAGSLATTGLGTALAPLYMAKQQGLNFCVYADETRPLLQGARLTEWELSQAGIDVSVICDNMAATLMAQNKIDLVIVGADRIAANGDVANKIGTLAVAIAANHFNIPFYVAAPMSTLDFKTASGDDIEIEQRPSTEIKNLAQQAITQGSASVLNPAFDVTPAALISGLITDAGLIKKPNRQLLAALNK